MNPVYKSFLISRAAKLHFTSPSFDYNKYGYTVKGEYRTNFMKFKEKNQGKYFYKQLATRYGERLEEFYFKSYSDGLSTFVSDLLDDKYHSRYQEYIKWTSNVTRSIQTDVDIIFEIMEDKEITLKDIFSPAGTDFPSIIRMYDQGYISQESMCILCISFKFGEVGYHHPFWDDRIMCIYKYGSYLDKYGGGAALKDVLTRKISKKLN